MALLMMDGFDTYASVTDMNNNGWAGDGGGMQTTGGRFNGCRLNTGSNRIGKSWGTSETEIWFGGALNYGSGGDYRVVALRSTINDEMCIQMNGTTGEVIAQRGTESFSLGRSAAGACSQGVWHWVECHFILSPTVGVFEVWVDGTRVLNITGANTRQNSGATGVVNIQFGSDYSGGATSWDDIYILNTSGSAPLNTRLGDCRIGCVLPSSDASPNNGTLSSGTSHFAVVNENPGHVDTSYSDITNTTGQEERFGVTSLPSAAQTVFAVKTQTWINKSDAGAANFEAEVVSGSSVAVSASHALSTSMIAYEDIFPLDPNGSIAWTNTTVGAMKIGVVIP